MSDRGNWCNGPLVKGIANISSLLCPEKQAERAFQGYCRCIPVPGSLPERVFSGPVSGGIRSFYQRTGRTGYQAWERIRSNALRIGENIREQLKIRTLKEALQACEVIYNALKIEFRWNLQSRIDIRRCFFSSIYSGEVCRIISSLDQGLLAGLSGGLRLEFSHRITEGESCCRAHLMPEGSSL
jgi:hypothetical protein